MSFVQVNFFPFYVDAWIYCYTMHQGDRKCIDYIIMCKFCDNVFIKK